MSRRVMMAVIIAILLTIATGIGYMVNEKKAEKKQQQEEIETTKNLLQKRLNEQRDVIQNSFQ